MAEKFLDCLGEACPVPLMRAQQELASLADGDVLTMTVDYACAVQNVPEWARGQGYQVKIEEIDEETWDIVIEKTT